MNLPKREPDEKKMIILTTVKMDSKYGSKRINEMEVIDSSTRSR